jgi:hypothetical protein
VYNGDRQAPSGSSKSFQKIRADIRSEQMADAPHIKLESQIGYPPHQLEKIQRSFDRHITNPNMEWFKVEIATFKFGE